MPSPWIFGEQEIIVYILIKFNQGLPISIFTADNTDKHSKDDLEELISELKMLKSYPDVRTYLSKRYSVEKT